MKNKIKYTADPMNDVQVIRDFLPSPDELAFRKDTVKVTLQLSRASIEYFKREAGIHNTPYQRMIRRLLDEYTAHHVH